MATATQNISVRITVLDGDKARRELILTGEQGQLALKKIKEATAPAARELLAVNVAGEQLRYGMENLSRGSGTLGLSLARLGPVGLAAAAAIGAVVLATAAGLREFKNAEQALNQFNAALRATDSASGVTAREILELGEAVQKNTLFKKDEILKAAAALTSYGNVQEDIFKRALTVSADLATRLGTDLPSAAEMLGKALEKPEDGVGKLGKRFTDLSPAQKQVIENFVKQGDVASAQALILEHLEGRIKGLAESQAQGLTGAADKLGDAWDDLLESFGRTVSESGAAQISISALTKVVRGLQEAIDNTPQGRKKRLEDQIGELEGSFGTALDRFVLGSAPVLEEKKRELKKINDELAEEEKKGAEEKAKALEAADLERSRQRNVKLLEIESEFQKKFKEATQTEREKAIEEAEQAKQRIAGLFKDDRNSTAARGAAEAVDENLRARLAKLDEEAAKPALALAEANDKVVESLRQRAELEGLADPKQRFIQAEVDKLNASATAEYREKVRALAATLYERQEATKAAKEADEAHQKAVQEINRELLRTKPSYDLAKQALDEWKEELIADLGGATEANQRYIDLIEQIYTVKLKDIYNKSLLDSNKWEDGASRALKRYADEATNAAKNSEEVFGHAASQIEDALVDALSSGEFSLKKLGDLVQSIEQDILRAFVREQITGPIAGALGDLVKGGSSGGGGFFSSIFSSLFHEGGMVGMPVSRRALPAYAFIGAPRFHDGLMPDEFPAILQKGETVLPKNSRMGGDTIVFNITTPDAKSFMDSRSQILAKFAGEMQRSRTRNS